MTTPKRAPKGAKTGSEAAAAKARVRRPAPERAGPIRSAAAAPAGPSGGSINDAIAVAVRAGYDVIAENIQQGRAAAEKFRQGEYNIRDVPEDVGTVLLRAIQLARDLSTTTFDVCERLLKETRSSDPTAGGPEPASGDGAARRTPPFRTHRPPPAEAQAPSGRMKLTVRFEGAPGAVSKTDALDRPSQPARPQDIVATPLAPRDPKGAVISDVKFEMDASVEGIVAVVTLPKGLAAGVYSGLVRGPGGDVPLGVLSVEIP